MIKVELLLDGGVDEAMTVESMVPAGDKFPYWTFYYPAKDGTQRVDFFNTKYVIAVSLEGVPEQSAFEQASDIVAREVDEGVPPDQVSGLFGKHTD